MEIYSRILPDRAKSMFLFCSRSTTNDRSQQDELRSRDSSCDFTYVGRKTYKTRRYCRDLGLLGLGRYWYNQYSLGFHDVRNHDPHHQSLGLQRTRGNSRDSDFCDLVASTSGGYPGVVELFRKKHIGENRWECRKQYKPPIRRCV